MNDKERQLRRYKNNLVTSGSAVIVFGLWEVLRVIIKILMTSEIFQTLVKAVNGQASNFTLGLIVIISLFIFSSFNLILRIFVGISARREGMGKGKGRVYPIFAFLLVIYVALNTIYDIGTAIYGGEDTATQSGIETASILMDLASLYATVVLARAIYKVRKYGKQL